MKEEVDNKVDKNELYELVLAFLFLKRDRNKNRENNLEQVYSFCATLNLSGACCLKVSGSIALNISACVRTNV